MRLLVTGGAGFIGSTFVPFALERWPGCEVVVLDKLTYAGRAGNLAAVAAHPRLRFIRGDICDSAAVEDAMRGCTHVVNLAAETHVDRSIQDSRSFVRTNVEGVETLLRTAIAIGVERYLQVSTDEVYGPIPAPESARESDPLRPRSPYAASKASGDLLTQAYVATYGLPASITRGTNTYGPFQYPEKLLPLAITNALDSWPVPIYGDGRQVRDWLHVRDHCAGIARVLETGAPGEIYNIGAGNERTNVEIIDDVLALVGGDPALKRHVADRPGHDRRYSVDTERVRSLGWAPEVALADGLRSTVRWYEEHRPWWEEIKSGEFRRYYEAQYGERLRGADQRATGE